MKLPPDEIEENLLKELALALYQRKILSFGKARQLAKMTKWQFQEEVGKRGIIRHYTEKELKDSFIWQLKIDYTTVTGLPNNKVSKEQITKTLS